MAVTTKAALRRPRLDIELAAERRVRRDPAPRRVRARARRGLHVATAKLEGDDGRTATMVRSCIIRCLITTARTPRFPPPAAPRNDTIQPPHTRTRRDGGRRARRPWRLPPIDRLARKSGARGGRRPHPGRRHALRRDTVTARPRAHTQGAPRRASRPRDQPNERGRLTTDQARERATKRARTPHDQPSERASDQASDQETDRPARRAATWTRRRRRAAAARPTSHPPPPPASSSRATSVVARREETRSADQERSSRNARSASNEMIGRR